MVLPKPNVLLEVLVNWRTCIARTAAKPGEEGGILASWVLPSERRDGLPVRLCSLI